MRIRSVTARQRARLALSTLLATVCLATTPAGDAQAAADLYPFGDDVELRHADTRSTGIATALDLGGLVSLPPGLGGADLGQGRRAAAVSLTLAAQPRASYQAVAAAAGPNLGPIVSGLPWRSGASCGTGAFETWRGRKLDVTAVGLGRRNWDVIAQRLREPAYKAAAASVPQLVIIFPLLPVSEFKQFAACARGDFDSRYRQLAGLLVQAGAGKAVLRLGWEANVGSRSHPWGIDTASDIPDYVRCFRRAAARLKATAPGVKIEWSNAKASALPVSVFKANPGDDVTDLWGLHYYDVNAQFRTQAAWDEFNQSTRFGGPQGLGRWLATARAHGKRLAVPEWGVWSREITAAEADNPLYIRNMYKAFKANTATIAYENYFNCPLAHRLHPDTPFPKASVVYRQLWSQGQ